MNKKKEEEEETKRKLAYGIARPEESLNQESIKGKV